ncbi:hypothetical protein LUZ60_007624 [Juncus effusus]|nr:hypothetical protein LUZ60_007624 [Juncus effusus]
MTLNVVALSRSPMFRISSYNVTYERRREASRIPVLAKCTANSDGKLVGGLLPSVLDPIPDASARRWHKGKPMRIVRSFFACASDGKRVFVAGGHHSGTSALKMVEAYDVEADEWVSHPDMLEKRKGRINAIVNEDIPLDKAILRRAASGMMKAPVSGQKKKACGLQKTMTGVVSRQMVSKNYNYSGKLYSIQKGQGGVREFTGRGKEWRKVADAPELVGSSPFAVSVSREGNEKVFVTGFHNNRYYAWLFDLKSRTWAPVEIPAGFDGFMNSIAAVRV